MEDNNNKYPHDSVSINVNGKDVDIESPSEFIVSHRTGEKIPMARVKRLYDIYGSYAKVGRELGITDKTIKKHLERNAPVSTSPSQMHKHGEPENGTEIYKKIPKTQHIATKASKVADNFIEGNQGGLDNVMSTLLDSLQDPTIIARAPLRDRAIAWGIVTERLQKAKELAIRQDEAEVKRFQTKYKEEELELRKREVAAMEKGVTISIKRNFQTVGDLEEVEEED